MARMLGRRDFSQVPTGGFSGWRGFDAGAGTRRLTDKLIELDQQRKTDERQKQMDEISKEELTRKRAQEDFDSQLKMVDLIEKMNLEAQPEFETTPTKIEKVKLEMPDKKDPELGVLKGGSQEIPLQVGGERLEVPAAPSEPVIVTDPTTGQQIPITPRSRQQQLSQQEQEFERALGMEERKKDVGRMTLGELEGVVTGTGDPDTVVTDAVAQSYIQNANRAQSSPWKLQKGTDNAIWRINPNNGERELVVAGKDATPELKDLSEKKIAELSVVVPQAERLYELARTPSAPKMEVVGWVPNIVRNMVAYGPDGKPRMITDDEAQKLAATYQQYEPRYFMFAAQMLKQVQGSRPSDKDMEWYLANLPRIDDGAEAKAQKLADLSQQLFGDYNAQVEGFKLHGRDVRFDTLQVPTYEEFLEMAVEGEDAAGPWNDYKGAQ